MNGHDALVRAPGGPDRRGRLQIIGVLLLAALLGACSAVRLAYNNLPTVSYWWLDGYVDFDGAQSLRVREALDGLLAWHRREELPQVLALLRRAQALAPNDITPAQACEFADAIRGRLLATAARAEAPVAEIAVTLSPAQLQHLQAKYAKVNAEYRKEWVSLDTAALHDKRYRRFLERHEDFYGALQAEQRAMLRRMTAESVFDARRADAERRDRQTEIVAMLRHFESERTPPAAAQSAIHALVQRIAAPPAGPWRDHQLALQDEGCRNLAALHNTTTPAQRERAVDRLGRYARDVEALVAAD
ncbi:MAG: hypothetical protein DI563_29020 [Variovorax paradoxus]|uniref:Lipoprotein n=1 Tax=Variovorax paradoxus TaxID=34073 RepID=A0A2W5P6L9_VARPD|nr:MAG: hypothetical protein DI563_29020 [Variovorax paradoxus]